MGFFDWARSLFGKLNRRTTAAGTLEKEFGVQPAASREMEDNINLWWSMYINHPPWETCDVHSLGLPSAIGRELASHAMCEFSIAVSGGARGSYLDEQMQLAAKHLKNDLEMGLCLGGVALKPYPDGNRLLVDACTTNFTPTRFDCAGKCIGGVFKSNPVRVGQDWYIKMEYHDMQKQDGANIYIIQNKAYKSGREGNIGQEVSLSVVEEWADLLPQMIIQNLESPLFAYFKPPISNNIEPSSQMGISVYGGATALLIKEADERWSEIKWEYASGQRKIFADNGAESSQFMDRLFEVGAFSATNDLFHEFSPEFRDTPLYNGFQRILQRIEFNTGLSYGTISDPQTVEKTATEILAAKHRQYVTEGDIQKEFEETLDNLLYAMNAWCDIARLAPAGEYKADYNWGDGILDDPDTRRQDMSMDLQLLNAGILNDWEFRVKWMKEDEATAKAALPKMEDMVDEKQDEVE